MRKFVLVVLVVLLAGMLAGCDSNQQLEKEQMEDGAKAIIQNQPVPDLGGYSLERANLIKIMLLRNQEIATYSYYFTITGLVVEICPSQGFPFPYSTQLTAPETYSGYSGTTLPQSEPNTLYPPESANASWVLCVLYGQTVPIYMEENVQAFPYRIKADIILEPITPATIDGIETMPEDMLLPQVLPEPDTLNGDPIVPSATVTTTGLFGK